MKLLHAMIRVKNVETTLGFFEILGIKKVREFSNPMGRFSLIYLSDYAGEFEIELTHNWDQQENYGVGDSFGHIAVGVNNIYKSCQELMEYGATICRPPRDGFMAFVKTPDGISIELLQQGRIGPPGEPWASMENQGTW